MSRSFGSLRLLAVGVTVVALAACGGSVSPTSPPPGATPSSSVSLSPSSSARAGAESLVSPSDAAPTPADPSPPPLIAGPAAAVTGTEDCSFTSGAPIVTGGTERLRGATGTCTDKANDPRVTGTTELTWSYDAWSPGRDDGTIGVQWGEAKLTGPAGAWTGRWAGVILPGLRDEITVWYRGTRAYKGLTYMLHVTGSLGAYSTEGVIYPGGPPAWP